MLRLWPACRSREKTKHPIPMDTRAWSQILVSTLNGRRGRSTKERADLADGSDVKAANFWTAIDNAKISTEVAKGRNEGESAGAIEILR